MANNEKSLYDKLKKEQEERAKARAASKGESEKEWEERKLREAEEARQKEEARKEAYDKDQKEQREQQAEVAKKFAALDAKFMKARAWCARQFKKRYEPREHASFLAGTILKEASERFELGDHGVEGWCDDVGRNGVQYLNFGDTYDPTIYVRTSPRSASFFYGRGGWGPLVGG